MCKKLTLIFIFTCTAWLASAQLVDVATGLDFPIDMALYGNDLYITENVSGELSKIDISQPMPIVNTELSGLSKIAGLYLDGDILYCTQLNSGIVSKIDLTQTPLMAEEVIDLQTEAIDLIIIGDEMFITTGSGGTIVKINITQANPTPTTVATGMDYPSGIINKSNVLYIAEFQGNRVSKVNLDAATPSPELVISGLNNPAGVTINGNFLYIAHTSNVSRIDINQTSPTLENVVTGLSDARLVTFDGLNMYIAESGSGKVSKLEIALPIFSTLPTVCSNAIPANLGGASPTGGTYSGLGVTDDGNGETFTFDPATAGGPGIYTITYTATNGSTATSTLEVVAPPIVSAPDDASISIDAGIIQFYDGTPAGGVYTGPGMLPGNMFDPMAAGLGMHTVTYTYTDANGCSGSDDAVATVIPSADNDCTGANNINNLLGGPVNTPQVSTLYDNTNYNSTGDPAIGYECFFENDGLQHTIWYSFAGDGNQYRIRSVECTATNYISEGDTQAAIYNGDCNSLTPVACTEDEDANLYNIDVTFVALPGVTYYMMVDGWNGKKGEFCLEVTNLGVSAAKEISTMGMKLYPNPTNGLVMFEGQTAQSVQVMDALGRTVHTQQTPAQQVDLSSLPGGMYTLLMDFGKEGLVSARVVKQ
ncbi:MAG: T9SS type A sorting domain-containing protein [Lewinellaceae bacterium]|nr:T9SS type A sorting domain-containing protein [Lewinellaceae bacterium]